MRRVVVGRHRSIVVDPLEYELQESRALALGLAGRRVEAMLSVLDALPYDAPSAQRDALLDDAGIAVWHYVIVRECAGFHDHAEALAFYGVPPRVLARVGVIRR